MSRDITRLIPYYGSNGTNATEVARLLAGRRWVCVPFVGGAVELRHIEAPTIVAGDLHEHVINLCNVVKSPTLGPRLYRHIRRRSLHPQELREAQTHCVQIEQKRWPIVTREHRLAWAISYFTACWMGRNGTAGTKNQFSGNTCIRWASGGGDPATRWRSAAECLRDFRVAFRRCTFEVIDAQDLLDRALSSSDKKDAAMYADPPFLSEDGRRYSVGMTLRKHKTLAEQLSSFKHAGVVLRLYEHPYLDRLYPAQKGWRRVELAGRDQNNKTDRPERLLIRNIDQEVLAA